MKSFFLLLCFPFLLISQEVPFLDALLFKENNLFARIAILKESPQYHSLKASGNPLWKIDVQEAEGKLHAVFSIKGDNTTLNHFEKFLFSCGFSDIHYNSKVISVSKISENYIPPESPEVIPFNRIQSK